MISGYLPGRSPLHRLPAGWKLAGLAGLSVLLLPAQSPLLLGAGLAAVLCAYAALGRPASRGSACCGPLLPILALMLVLQLWAQDWSPAGLVSGLVIVMRILLMVMLADLVTLSTPLQDMMDVLEWLASPLRRLGLEPRRLALAVALVLRFVPVLLASWQARTEAWRARSPRRPGSPSCRAS